MAPNDLFDFELYCRVCTIIIDSEEPEEQRKSVKVSAALLAANSFYFETAFAKLGLGEEIVTKLPHGSPSTFEIFMVWLNTGDIKNASSFQGHIEIKDDQATRVYKLSVDWNRLVDCYLMADYIQAPRYMNFIMNILVTKLKEFEDIERDNDTPYEPLCNSCASTINLVWNQTLSTSPLRKLVLDSLNSTHHAP